MNQFVSKRCWLKRGLALALCISIGYFSVCTGGSTEVQAQTVAKKASNASKFQPNYTTSLSPHVPGVLLVKFRTGTSAQSKKEFLSRYGAVQTDTLQLVGADVVKFNTSKNPLDYWLRIINGASIVEFAEPDYLYKAAAPVIPNDSLFPRQWNLHNTGYEDGPDDIDINAPEAWEILRPSKASTPVLVAVVDTGVNYKHPDLKDSIWRNPKESLNGRDDDRNGIVDDVFGADFFDRDGDPMDVDGHGTNVAGVIAAKADNRRGVAGITGLSENIKIVPIRILGPDGRGRPGDAFTSNSMAILSIEYCIRNKIWISNNSWAGPKSEFQRRAIAKYGSQGGLFIAAAGNGGNNNDTSPYQFHPASYRLPNIISVASAGPDGNLSATSTYGARTVHLAAPGLDIWTTLHPNSGSGSLYGYYTDGGTSMATPHVSGVAALIWSQFPTLRNTDVKARILNNTRPLSGLSGKVITGGMVDAEKALKGTNQPSSLNLNRPRP